MLPCEAIYLVVAVFLMITSVVTDRIKLKMSPFIYLGFYVAFNTVQVISRWVVGRAEETSMGSTTW